MPGLGWVATRIGSRQRCLLPDARRGVWACSGARHLAADQGRPGAALGTGAMTLAQNFATEAEVDAAYAAALAAGAPR